MNILAAVDENMGIGFKNNLLFNIPEDKKFFKEKTIGKTVIMGRKTYESLPVKPLPNRRNIILTHSRNLSFYGAEVCCTIDELNKILLGTDDKDIFVIGGEQIYSLLFTYCDIAYITKIFSTKPADKYIVDFDKLEDWICTEKSEIKKFNGISFQFRKYIKTGSLHI